MLLWFDPALEAGKLSRAPDYMVARDDSSAALLAVEESTGQTRDLETAVAVELQPSI